VAPTETHPAALASSDAPPRSPASTTRVRARAYRRRRVAGLVWTVPALAVLAVFVYLPLAENFGYSFLEWDIYSSTFTFVGGDNYHKLVGDPVFWRALRNNVTYAVVSIVVQVFAALVLAALVEGIRSDRWKSALRAVYFIPSAISITVAGLLFYFIYEPDLGLLNALLASTGLDGLQHAWLGDSDTALYGIIAMSQWQGFGYSTLLFSLAIQRIPGDILEAAAIDGVGPLRRFFQMTVPLVRDMTSLMLIVTVSGAFQVFNEVMVMTSGGPNNSSQVLGTWLYQSGFVRNDFGYAAAIAVVVFVVTLLVALGQMALNRRRKVEW
jgi:raffinose/stachyose/melibiose transport system permease protein